MKQKLSIESWCMWSQ